MACKNKWWPHNWLCLKGLYWIFVALFYATLAFTLYAIYQILVSPMLTGYDMWSMLFNVLISNLSMMLGLLTVAAILKTLRKIKKAVAPCCCEAKKEEVVVVSTENK